MPSFRFLDRSVQLCADRQGTTASAWRVAGATIGVLLALLTLRNGAAPVMAPWDVFTLLAGAWKIAHGLVPHIDFYNPIGSLSYILVELGMKLSHPSVSAIAYASVLFLVLVGPWAWGMARRRLSGLHGFLFTVLVAVLAVTMRPLGYDVHITTYAMIYNRFAWVLISMLSLQLFLDSGDQRRRAVWAESLSVGMLLALILYCKVSYFGLGGVAVVVAIVVYPRWRSSPGARLLALLLGLLLVGGAMALFYHIDPVAYLRDLLEAERSQSSGMRRHYLLRCLRDSRLPLAMLSLTLGLGLMAPLRAASLRLELMARARLAVVFGFLVGAAVILGAANAPEHGQLPLYFVAGLIVAEELARRLPPPGEPGRTREQLRYLGVLLCLIPVLFGGIVGRDLLSIASTTRLHGYRVSRGEPSQRFDAENLADFVIPAGSNWHTAYWRAHFVPARINEGIHLLEAQAGPQSHVVTLALTNPFSFALGLPPFPGPPLWWDVNFSFNEAVYPEAIQVFGDADFVMIPVLGEGDDGCCWSTVELLRKLYDGYLTQHFEDAGQSEHWLMLRRKS